MDGPFWVDTRAPHLSGDAPQITVIATNVALLPVANLPVLGGNYFSYVGKAVRLTMFGRWSTAASPGTQTFTFLWGNGASANGTAIVSSAAITPGASLVNVPWEMQVTIRCRTMGATGTLFGTGWFQFINSNTTTTAATSFMIPAGPPAASASLDLTAANIISPQVLATTSTTNTMTIHDFLFESLN
jgi:hypothetical protein